MHTAANGASAAIPLNRTNQTSTTSFPWDQRFSFSSLHPGGVQFGMADGSVRFLSENIALTVLRGLATMDGAEAVQVP